MWHATGANALSSDLSLRGVYAFSVCLPSLLLLLAQCCIIFFFDSWKALDWAVEIHIIRRSKILTRNSERLYLTAS
ncbi:hypothetical protein EDC56_3696 [Sinobacterium caligoides]|uniref:Uncharacterized protein n=1 Tax=Sinobacterium caligoides TaxID=933926 RepID=A0A3N2DE14_9GAMM|nr:hypothetical protein EDC56_3696 [Sinobacterium caligoides]